MPKAAPIPCRAPRCRSYATKKGYVTEVKAKQWNHGGKSRHDRGYGSDWDKLRKIVLERDEYLCQKHLAEGIYREGNEVDHIISKHKGGTNDLSNLQSLCNTCHREKTLKEAANVRNI